MSVQEQIDAYIASLPQAKREDLQTLHQMAVRASPGCRLWWVDGRNAGGKIVSNPSIGYGVQSKSSARGEAKTFYRIGLSANTGGISLYVMGLDDRTHLAATYGERLGKAKITGYCVKFRRLADVDAAVIEEMVAEHLG
ncbi:MAG TPA: DUF1801 domain-containing protein [Caulobacteraceae bacterium]|jgi:hypothetical protein|nr:DUF1801 domain-containing protein [Caulobacteraceae bacterium]